MAGGEFVLNHESDDTNFMVIGSAAEGSIEARDDQFERLEEFTERIDTGEFHHPVDIDDLAACVDGRRPKHGTGKLIANAAGGTLTYYEADHLTTRRIIGEGSTIEGLNRMLTHLESHGVVRGDHMECGANNHREPINAYIAQRGDVLRDWAGKLGIKVSDEDHELITDRARSTTNFSPPADVIEALREHTSESLVPDLQGDHKEVVTVINTREGTTLDRYALADVFGPDMQAFNVDAWQFENAARKLADDDVEVRQKVAAMVYYNLATAFVLSGPGMRVVVVE